MVGEGTGEGAVVGVGLGLVVAVGLGDGALVGLATGEGLTVGLTLDLGVGDGDASRDSGLLIGRVVGLGVMPGYRSFTFLFGLMSVNAAIAATSSRARTNTTPRRFIKARTAAFLPVFCGNGRPSVKPGIERLLKFFSKRFKRFMGKLYYAMRICDSPDIVVTVDQSANRLVSAPVQFLH